MDFDYFLVVLYRNCGENPLRRQKKSPLSEAFRRYFYLNCVNVAHYIAIQQVYIGGVHFAVIVEIHINELIKQTI